MSDERDPLARAARDEQRRRERKRREGERTLAQQLALAGSIGWLVVTPALLGIALGRWLDRRLGTGITLTAALLFFGVGAGFSLAWRRLHET